MENNKVKIEKLDVIDITKDKKYPKYNLILPTLNSIRTKREAELLKQKLDKIFNAT